MKKLILFRHGKSSWDENLTDQFRSINDKGIHRTKLSSHKLNDILDFEPKNVFCSVATRAKQTVEIAKSIVFKNTDIVYDTELYTFSHKVLKNWIKSLDNSLDHAIIFGHNPAFTDIAYDLGSEFILNIPTSGVVWIEFDEENWSDIIKGKTKYTIFPRDLE